MSGSHDPAKLAWLAANLGVTIQQADPRQTLDAFTRRLNGLMPTIRDVLATKQPPGPEIRALVAEAGEHARNSRFNDAHSLLDRVQGLLPSRTGTDQPTPQDGQAQWKSARGTAVAALTLLEAAMRKSPHPQRDAAIILVRGIRANLTERPETPQQLGELERYLNTDAIIVAAETPNVFGIQISLKQPLLRAVASLRAQIADQPGKAA